jgi:hypothetical protein
MCSFVTEWMFNALIDAPIEQKIVINTHPSRRGANGGKC